MQKIDLGALSLEELKRLQKDVEKAITGFEERKMAEARAALEAKARELGFSLGELTGGKPSRKQPQGAPKYRHPENPSITWTGRGRKPKWVTEHLAAGKPMEDLEI